MKTRILITGASGYLGQHVLFHLANENKYDLTASYGSLESFEKDCDSVGIGKKVKLVNSEELNLAEPEIFWRENGPFDVIINLAAQSNLNKCEVDRDAAKSINVDIPMTLYRQAEEQLSPCLFIALSTDQVYDGSIGNYSEKDVCNPVNYYGQTKLEMEQQLISQDAEGIAKNVVLVILRSSNILGGPTPIGACRKSSFLQWVRSAVENTAEKVNVFQDEFRNAIFVGDVVQIMCTLIKKHAAKENIPEGIYNMGGPERVNRYQIASAVAKWAQLTDTSHIIPVERANLPKENCSAVRAESPLDTSMTSNKLENLTEIIFSTLDQIVLSSFNN